MTMTELPQSVLDLAEIFINNEDMENLIAGKYFKNALGAVSDSVTGAVYREIKTSAVNLLMCKAAKRMGDDISTFKLNADALISDPMELTYLYKKNFDVSDLNADADWENRYGSIVWVRNSKNDPWWPSYICNPKLLDPEVCEGLRDLAIANIGRKHLVYYYGEASKNKHGFVKPIAANMREYFECRDEFETQTAETKKKTLQRALPLADSEAVRDIDLRIEWAQLLHEMNSFTNGTKKKIKQSGSLSSNAQKKKNIGISAGQEASQSVHNVDDDNSEFAIKVPARRETFGGNRSHDLSEDKEEYSSSRPYKRKSVGNSSFSSNRHTGGGDIDEKLSALKKSHKRKIPGVAVIIDERPSSEESSVVEVDIGNRRSSASSASDRQSGRLSKSKIEEPSRKRGRPSKNPVSTAAKKDQESGDEEEDEITYPEPEEVENEGVKEEEKEDEKEEVEEEEENVSKKRGRPSVKPQPEKERISLLSEKGENTSSGVRVPIARSSGRISDVTLKGVRLEPDSRREVLSKKTEEPNPSSSSSSSSAKVVTERRGSLRRGRSDDPEIQEIVEVESGSEGEGDKKVLPSRRTAGKAVNYVVDDDYEEEEEEEEVEFDVPQGVVRKATLQKASEGVFAHSASATSSRRGRPSKSKISDVSAKSTLRDPIVDIVKNPMKEVEEVKGRVTSGRLKAKRTLVIDDEVDDDDDDDEKVEVADEGAVESTASVSKVRNLENETSIQRLSRLVANLIVSTKDGAQNLTEKALSTMEKIQNMCPSTDDLVASGAVERINILRKHSNSTLSAKAKDIRVKWMEAARMEALARNAAAMGAAISQPEFAVEPVDPANKTEQIAENAEADPGCTVPEQIPDPSSAAHAHDVTHSDDVTKSGVCVTGMDSVAPAVIATGMPAGVLMPPTFKIGEKKYLSYPPHKQKFRHKNLYILSFIELF